MALDNGFINKLSALCSEKKFKKRGNSFFRVWGDGVLQVIKLRHEMNGGYYELAIGLFSMYGDLSPRWFTSLGSITRYPVVCFVGKHSCAYLETNNGYRRIKVVPPEDQIAILVDNVFPWLEQITTQECLAEGICALDAKMYDQIIWNDMLKFAPYLHSKNVGKATRVIQAALEQHTSVIEANRKRLSPDEFMIFSLEFHEEINQLEKKLQLARFPHKQPAIDYLTANYSTNIQLAKSYLKR